MMSITEDAFELLSGVLERAPQSGDGAAVRIVSGPQGWSMELDRPRPQDATFDYKERTVLILGADVAESLRDSTLDVRDTPDGLRLQLR